MPGESDLSFEAMNPVLVSLSEGQGMGSLTAELCDKFAEVSRVEPLILFLMPRCT